MSGRTKKKQSVGDSVLRERYNQRIRWVMAIDAHSRETRPFASEVKFLVDATTGAAIRTWVRASLDPDPHGRGPFGDEYRTASLYFDTDEGDVFHRRGSFGRSKYRVRRYDASSSVFLERKLRRPGILVKRRTTVPIDALARLTQPDSDPGWAGAWFHRRLRLREINPVCEVSYLRMARTARTSDGPVRLTLDADVRVAPASQAAFGPDTGVPVFEDRMILELKYRHQLPLVFKTLIATFLLAPQATSKYRLGVTTLKDVGFPLVVPVTATGGLSHV
jgi:hypothetical protein